MDTMNAYANYYLEAIRLSEARAEAEALDYSLDNICDCRVPGAPSHLRLDHEHYVPEDR